MAADCSILHLNFTEVGQCILTQYLLYGTLLPPPRGTPGAIATNMGETVSGTDLQPCATFQPNPFISFGSRTDRQTDRKCYKIVFGLVKLEFSAF